MDDALSHRYDAARELMTTAGELAGAYFERVADLQIHSNGTQDLVTEADVEVELLLKRVLAERFPDDAFFGEETGAAKLESARGVWVVDPIDGTQPFVSGMVSWCVSLAYVRDGVLEFGFVSNPPLGELFEGGRTWPALLSGRPITPHPGRTVADGIVAVGYSPRVGADDIVPVMDRLLRRGGMYFRNGSGALCLCYVACGRLLGYVEPHINSYDCLGGLAVVEAAGGRTNDFLTGDALLSGNRIVAAAAPVYDALDEILGHSPSRSGP